MDKEDVAHIYNRILFGQERMKTYHHIHLDGIGGCYAEQNKSIRERQLVHGFTPM